ncbi:hypothetical protein [Periweissella cryptocerci]|uniref:hypothetical protein n=1 Tax=Periweissella cryptocerci TaxID=2506420 RepID=UPI001404FB28|nr:hypothetical protein [Periweissella cryptocerci]
MSAGAGPLALAPISAAVIAVVATAITAAIGYIPDSHGAWFEFIESGLIKYGKQ